MSDTLNMYLDSYCTHTHTRAHTHTHTHTNTHTHTHAHTTHNSCRVHLITYGIYYIWFSIKRNIVTIYSI